MQRPIEYLPTRDGARIACKRIPSDGPPVVFVHGLAVNADIWDIPEIRGDGFTFESLPARLAARGCDVWLVNLRGHGAPHMLSEPPAGQGDWCVDHFALYDLPAVLEHVAGRAARPVFVVASSMGAMTTAATLQGATMVGYGALQSIIADEAAARLRHARIAGCVLLEMPAALRWPQSMYDDRGQLKWNEIVSDRRWTDGQSNALIELLARVGWMQVLIDVLGEIRLEWLRPPRRAENVTPDVTPTSQAMRTFAERAKARAMKLYAEQFKGSQQFCADTFLDGLLHAVDHMKAGVLRQLSKCVRVRAFVSALGAPDHVYSDHYDMIEAPLLVMAGGRDRIAHPAVLREAFVERVRSRDLTFRVFEDIAHGEFEYSPAASQTVYPQIVSWIEERAR